MRTLTTLLALGAALLAGSAMAADLPIVNVANTSFVAVDGSRTLQESIEINAPVEPLWKAFTDATEFKRWNSPVAAIDLRVGGSLEASYDRRKKIGDPDNIKHRIITFLPGQLIVFQNIQAPKELPHADLFQKTVTIVQYEPLSPTRTRVIISSTGWGTDPMSGEIYDFFQVDNAELLEKMKAVYETH